MKILGLNAFGHDTGAAMFVDGRLHAISEERLNRHKNTSLYPMRSIEYLLRIFRMADLNEVDLVITSNLGYRSHEEPHRRLRDLGYRGKIHAILHHDAHAASAYYPSGFEDAAIFVIDGQGSRGSDREDGQPAHYFYRLNRRAYELQSTYRGHGNSFRRIHRTMSTDTTRNGIGLVYKSVSCFLNFGEFGSGKVMGLAPYGGKQRVTTRPFFEEYDGEIIAGGTMRFKTHPDYFSSIYFGGAPPRASEPLPDDFYTEIAWQVQEETERALIRLGQDLYEVTRSPNLCIAGGVGLNSVANKKILDQTDFESVFIQPSCDDSGVALGCALWGIHRMMGVEERVLTMRTAFLGRPYREEEIRELLESAPNIKYEKVPNIVSKTAELLAQGNIVGWFQGGSEIGPRALGHRSILCDPRDPEMKDILNEKVKHREGFRPFAPSILLEYDSEYFDLDCESPFMLLIARVKEDKRKIVPAITHVDGTARIQTVTRRDNGIYYDLISEFHRLTDVPVILNTSFNVAGEPIVESPADALRCFLTTHMDYLVLGDYLVEAISKQIPPLGKQTTERERGLRARLRRFWGQSSVA